jgi:feruloyl-CoA synthase
VQLLPYLEADPELARSFFRHLKMVFYAAADMPQPTWRRIEALAAQYSNRPPYFASAWGMSENIATSTIVHFPIEQAGFIGLPVPGTTIKLVPTDGKMELRLRGPALTPGYLGRPDLTTAALDEEGFYRSGDAGRLVDPDNPSLGFAFDGRTGENFKLSTGRWIFVGQTRVRAVADGEPIADDVVVTGPGRDEAGLLIFLNIPACRSLSSELASAGVEELSRSPKVRARIQEMLRKISADPKLSLSIRRAIILTEPPSIDGHETTDKGSLNQRAILERRRAIVDRLYEAKDPDVIMIE